MEISTKLEQICQCCLTEEGILINMLTENFKADTKNVINEIYKKCSGVNFEESSYKLGQHICENCLSRLAMTYEFREQCKSSYTILKEKYEALLAEVKDEPMSDDEPLVLNNDEPGKMTQVFVRDKASERDEIKNEVTCILPMIEAKAEVMEVKISPQNMETDQFSDAPEDSTHDNDENTVETPEKDPTANEEIGEMEAEFMCLNCDTVLMSHNDYIIHRDIHIMEQATVMKSRSVSRKCNLCGEYQASYIKHLDSKHRDYRPNKCKKCKSSFTMPRDLKKHLFIHMKSDTFECLGCNKKFQSHIKRKLHLEKDKHSKDVYRCKVCGLGCEKFENLHKHFTTEHSMDYGSKQLFPCFDCRGVFSYLKYLLQHKCTGRRKRSLASLPPGAPTFACDLCSQQFADDEEMFCHKLTVCAARCKCSVAECGRVFKTQHALSKHMHLHDPKATFICEECGYTANTAHKLSCHKKKHKATITYVKCPHIGCTAELKSDFTLQFHLRTHAEGTFECDLCQKRFRLRASIQAHMNKNHIPQEQLKHGCEVCQKRFFTVTELKLHGRMHNDERFRCKYCPKSYREPCNLTEHVRRAHEGVVYACIYCNKKYVERMRMKLHLFEHRGFKPYNCPVCSVSFVKRYLYAKHLLGHNIVFDDKIHGYKEKEDLNETLKACKRMPNAEGRDLISEVAAEASEDVLY